MASNKTTAVLSPVNVVKEINCDSVVKKWRELGQQLCGQNPELNKIPSSSNALSSVIRLWLFGSQAGMKKSWRSLIWALDAIDETCVADTLMDFTEPPSDSTVTLNNLSSVMQHVKPDNRPQVWSDLGVPSHRSRVINTSNVDEYVNYYVNTCPDPSEMWKNLYCTLYKLDEVQAMTEIQKVCTMKTNSKFTVENISAILIAWAPQDMTTAFAPLVPRPRLAFIMENYSTMTERCSACAEYCVNYNPEFRLLPGDTWSKFVKIMNRSEASHQSLAMVNKIRKKPSIGVMGDKMQSSKDKISLKLSDNASEFSKQEMKIVPSPGKQAIVTKMSTGSAVSKPVTTVHRKNHHSARGEDITMSMSSHGSKPLNYQWKKGSKDVRNGKETTGAALSHKCVLKFETAKGVAQDLFKQLNLSQYYPQKLTLSHALCIAQDTLQSIKCTDPRKLYLYILEKLMSYHYKCRADLFKPEQEESDDDDDDIFKRSVKSEVSKTSNSIHPMDSLLALIHCADDFFRQDLLFRLAKCQLSVPLILPDPSTGQLSYLIWALRSIVKEWKSALKGSEQVQEALLIACKIPIVSFIRFNKSISKSKMMNDVINDEYHDYFFHRDCQGGRYSRLLGEGLVDVCWYLPGGKKDDVFPLPVAFQNLHGDARKHRQQIEFMSRTCYMCFVLITEDDLDDEAVEVLEKLSKAPEGIILLQCSAIDQSHLLKKIKNIPEDKLKGFEVFNKNVAELKTMIRKRIRAKLAYNKWIAHEHDVKTLVECKNMAHPCKIKVDEDKPELHEGQNLAMNIFDMICCEDASAKEKMLPLQGHDLWQKWAKLDKEEYRPVKRGAKRAVDFIEEMYQEKEKIRELQLCHITGHSSKVMQTFIDYVSRFKGNRRKYFLQSLRLSLNDRSRDTISKLQQMYREKRSKLLQAESASDNAKLFEIKKEIQGLQKEIIRVSLGLEHFLREMGQVYEATCGSHLQDRYRCLPSIAAELLIDGFPLEIMDGDAAHVPEKWISSVMHEIVVQLKDPNVFVMSVLGLQSTGKSTLINTAFGLQFNVSAGRCTRGAFMQLIPIGGTLQEESKCDYVVVVDTEGLRAPELDSQQTHKHDNELATFVTGLANVTMINIYGETPGDMDDILQTTVHALLRMRNVHLNPSCKFVHQNVGAVAASDKGGMGRARFKDKLDEMTRIAAKAEECENDYKHFKDVIKFNEEKDVFHFKGLWKGDPPMAPVNTGYSEAALSLKHNLVEMVRQSTTKFSSVATRIEDLWKALLHENFVFSFQNTLELNIYIALHTRFIQWSRTLGSKMLKWEEEIMEKEIKQAMNPETLKDTLLGQKIPTYVVQLFGDVEQEMKKYFEQSEHREVLVQWQKETENRLERLKFQLQNETKDHCIQMIKGQQAHNDISSETSAYRAKVKERVQGIVQHLSGQELRQINEMRLKQIFNLEWKDWVGELKLLHASAADDTNVSHLVEEILAECFKTEQHKLYRKLPVNQWGKKLELEVYPRPEHVKGKTFFGSKADLTGEQKREAWAVAETALSHAKLYLNSIKNKNFHLSLVHELLKEVDSTITNSSHQLIFTAEYRMVVSLTACGYAVGMFEEMIKAFDKKNDPIELLERERSRLYTYFLNQYKEQVEIVKKREEEEEQVAKEVAARERKAKIDRERITREEEDLIKASERAKAAREEATILEEGATAKRERMRRELEALLSCKKT